MTKKQVLAMLYSDDEPDVPEHLRQFILDTRKLFAQFKKNRETIARLKAQEKAKKSTMTRRPRRLSVKA